MFVEIAKAIILIITVIPLFIGVVGKVAVQTDTEVMTIVVKLLGVVDTRMSKNRLVVSIGECGVGKQGRLRSGIFRIVVINLTLRAVHVAEATIVESSAIKRNLACRVNFIVDAQEHVGCIAAICAGLGGGV